MKNNWIIFDGDNTLWHSESLYDNARTLLCDFLSQRGHNYDAVHDYQQQRDKTLFTILGYDRSRFSKSFFDTLMYFEPNASSYDADFVQSLALNVFTLIAEPVEQAGPVLNRLSNLFHLALLTAGDKEIQKSRIDSFPFKKNFEIIEIVPEKNEKVLLNFIKSKNIPCNEAIVVGDSLRSDILPAVSCGLDAVWLINKNWSHVELDGYVAPKNVYRAKSLTELEAKLHALIKPKIHREKFNN